MQTYFTCCWHPPLSAVIVLRLLVSALYGMSMRFRPNGFSTATSELSFVFTTVVTPSIPYKHSTSVLGSGPKPSTSMNALPLTAAADSALRAAQDLLYSATR